MLSSRKGLCAVPVCSSEAGFTLIELMVTLALIVIGLTLSFPSLRRLYLPTIRSRRPATVSCPE